MYLVYTLILTIAFPWFLDARDAWRRHRTVRREVRDLDLEIQFLA